VLQGIEKTYSAVDVSRSNELLEGLPKRDRGNEGEETKEREERYQEREKDR
jgi:hypothetical protein